MRVRSAALLVFVVCLLPIAAQADITSISPQSISFGSTGVLTVSGNNLSGTELTLVVFDGPGGQFSLQPTNSLPPADPDDIPQFPETELIVFIPIDVTSVSGDYQVTVVAKDVGMDAQTFGPVTFTVEGPSSDGPPLISSQEIQIEEATSSRGAIVNLNVSAQNPNGDPVPVTCLPESGSQFPLRSTLVTCSATNSFGTSTAQINVLVVDFTPPVVTVPTDIVSSTPVVTFAASAVDQIDGTVPVTCSPSSGSTFGAGVTQVVCSASDSSANVGFGTFTVTLPGGMPVITVPADITVDSPDGEPVVVPFTVTATNDATIVCLYGAGVPFEGNRFGVGVTTLTCTARNLTGSDTKSFSVTVNDLSAPLPVLTVPADIITEATSPSGAIVTFEATSTNGGVVVCTPESGSTFALGQTSVSCTATNAAGTDTETFNVTVTDTTAPVLTLPDDIDAVATGPSGAVVVFAASGTDVVDGVIAATCVPVSGSTFAVGTTVVSCSVEDLSGNSASGAFNVIVHVPPPVLTVPADITAEATSPAGAVVSFTATATNDGIVVCLPASGSTFALGQTTVSCTATNAGGSDTETFNVTVRDTTAPALTLPSDITAEATGANGAVVAFAAWGTDAVSGVTAATCTPASGSVFAIGTTAVSCTASDGSGNTSNGAFNVTVRDTTPPVLNLPATITAEAVFPGEAKVNYTASASDAVDGNVAVTCTPPSGTKFHMGTTAVSCTAHDSANNVANGTFNVIVRDTTPPHVFLVQALPDFLWPADKRMVTVTVLVLALDSVDILPTSRIVSVSSNQPVTGPGDTTTPDWIITGSHTVKLRAERTNNVERVYTITIETSDEAGNTVISTEDVRVAKTRRRAS